MKVVLSETRIENFEFVFQATKHLQKVRTLNVEVCALLTGKKFASLQNQNIFTIFFAIKRLYFFAKCAFFSMWFRYLTIIPFIEVHKF